jgi:large subunit ribosomal protein L5
MTENIYQKYQKEGIAELTKKLNIKNIMAVPKLSKIVVNCGLGEALKDKKVVETMSNQLAIITGQKPQVCKSKKAISTFKLRIGDPIGLKITLRGKRMYEFLTKLISVALPRVRDFRGIPQNGFDGKGNFTMGVREQTIFPDLDYKLVDKVRGFEITFVTSAQNDTAGFALLEYLGLPFEKKEKK